MRIVSLMVLLAALAGCGAPVHSPAGSDPGPLSALAAAFETATSCVAVDIPPEPPLSAGGPATVVGTLMVPSNGSRTLVILVPGGDSTGDSYDLASSPEEKSANLTLPRYLATRGVATYAFDRPGMGRSSYDGPMQSIAQVEAVLEQVIAAARAGDWLANATCGRPATTSFETLVIGGLSLGGMISANYAASHADMDGLLLMGPWFNGLAARVVGHIAVCAASNPDPRVTDAFCEEGAAVGPCEIFVHAPTANMTLANELCQTLYDNHESVSGDAFRYDAQPRALIPRIAPVPVFLVFYEFDHVVAEEGLEQADRDLTVATFDLLCPCDAEHVIVPSTGHGYMVHPGQETGFRATLEWLQSEGLAGAPPA